MSYYAGIMTGTSLDAIDVAICSFQNHAVDLKTHYSHPWPEQLRTLLLEFSEATEVNLDRFVRAHFTLPGFYNEAIDKAVEQAGMNRDDINAIGLHGQTVRHLPLLKSVSDG